jgi:hypothetical protein
MKESDENGGNHMRWSEVQKLFPDTLVLVEDRKSQTVNGAPHVAEVAVIRPLRDGKEAMDELMKSHGKVFVYHTKHDVVMPIRTKPAYRGVVQW